MTWIVLFIQKRRCHNSSEFYEISLYHLGESQSNIARVFFSSKHMRAACGIRMSPQRVTFGWGVWLGGFEGENLALHMAHFLFLLSGADDALRLGCKCPHLCVGAWGWAGGLHCASWQHSHRHALLCPSEALTSGFSSCCKNPRTCFLCAYFPLSASQLVSPLQGIWRRLLQPHLEKPVGLGSAGVYGIPKYFNNQGSET